MEKACSNQHFLVLMQTAKAIHERIKREIASFNLTITEFSVLEVLYHKEKQTIQQIGTSILISSGSMTYVIDKLEQKGLLTRNDCPNDRRVIHITLTDDGKVLMNKIMPNHQALIDTMFASLQQEEAKAMVKALQKVSRRAEE